MRSGFVGNSDDIEAENNVVPDGIVRHPVKFDVPEFAVDVEGALQSDGFFRYGDVSGKGDAFVDPMHFEVASDLVHLIFDGDGCDGEGGGWIGFHFEEIFVLKVTSQFFIIGPDGIHIDGDGAMSGDGAIGNRDGPGDHVESPVMASAHDF